MPESIQRDLMRRYARYQRVKAIHKRNSRYAIRKEYGVSEDKINYLLGMKRRNGKREKTWRDTVIGRFMTMPLSVNHCGVTGYY